MEKIEIPKRLEDKLDEDSDYSNIVKSIIRRFSPNIKENKLEFFPEYTDHGFLHINKTLDIANRLINKETFEKLTTFDIGVIILSIFVHDLGMHFTYESFIELISNKSNIKIDNDIDNNTWETLWDEYFTESKLWSAKKIKSIFNDEYQIKQPPYNRGQATENDKKFIGEFIRRYHPRIAYEICVFGFLNAHGEYVELSTEFDSKIKKIIGLIARSHGINIWDAVNYIEKEFGREQIRATKNIHAIYVMVVLRIADYLDMDKNRANTPILKFRKINSSISELEWIKHNTIDHVKMQFQDDPESIFVYVNEISESNVYLSVERLLKDMQKELDTCWAVLGKVYGSHENLKLAFRRIHSNMDNKDIFLKNIDFIPERIKFDSNPDILKLLIEPLYGKNPAYGIRELLQNSIDACIEKEKILLYKEEMKVILTISEDENCLIIEDNGIGMNKNILINYFLVAGASFRNSDIWKKIYCNENKSLIPRSGRFGVGVFASFLLGNEIDVETFRYKEDIGYKFNAYIDSDQLQVMKIKNNNKSGTKIKIKLYEGVIKELKRQFTSEFEALRWNRWYCSSNPKLIVNTPENWEESRINDKFKVHLYDGELEDYWNSIKPNGFFRVDWTYKSTNEFCCNGIAIKGNGFIYRLKNYRFPERFNYPSISVVDNDANLPLNLDRNGISDNSLPFETELVCDIYKDIIAKLLVSSNICELSNDYLIIRDTKLKHDAINDRNIYNTLLKSHELLLTKTGFNILHHYVLKNLETKVINKVWVNDRISKIDDSEIMYKFNNLVVSRENLSSIQKFKEAIDCNAIINLGQSYTFEDLRIYMRKIDFDYLFEEGTNRIRSGFKSSMKIENESNNWYCITNGNVPNTKMDIQDFERNTDNINLFIEYYFKTIEKDRPNSGNYEQSQFLYEKYYHSYYEINVFEELMKKYIGENNFINYKINERKDKYKLAFTELERYMKKFVKSKN